MFNKLDHRQASISTLQL